MLEHILPQIRVLPLIILYILNVIYIKMCYNRIYTVSTMYSKIHTYYSHKLALTTEFAEGSEIHRHIPSSYTWF